MKIKVSNTTLSQIDWLVAKCEGYNPTWFEPKSDFRFEPHVYLTFLSEYKPSIHWAQGGPILEREKIGVDYYNTGKPLWIAGIAGMFQQATGPTPLIAGLRCYVSSRLGDEVEVPDDLA